MAGLYIKSYWCVGKNTVHGGGGLEQSLDFGIQSGSGTVSQWLKEGRGHTFMCISRFESMEQVDIALW